MLHSFSGYKYTMRRTKASVHSFIAVAGICTTFCRGVEPVSAIEDLFGMAGGEQERQRRQTSKVWKGHGSDEGAISATAAGVKVCALGGLEL